MDKGSWCVSLYRVVFPIISYFHAFHHRELLQSDTWIGIYLYGDGKTSEWNNGWDWLHDPLYATDRAWYSWVAGRHSRYCVGNCEMDGAFERRVSVDGVYADRARRRLSVSYSADGLSDRIGKDPAHNRGDRSSVRYLLHHDSVCYQCSWKWRVHRYDQLFPSVKYRSLR